MSWPVAKLVHILTSHYLFLQSGSSKWSFEHHSRIGLQTPTQFGRKNDSYRLSQKKKRFGIALGNAQVNTISLETSQKAACIHVSVINILCINHPSQFVLKMLWKHIILLMEGVCLPALGFSLRSPPLVGPPRHGATALWRWPQQS